MKELAEFSKSGIAFRIVNRIWDRLDSLYVLPSASLPSGAMERFRLNWIAIRSLKRPEAPLISGPLRKTNHGLSKSASPSLDSATGLVLANSVHFLGIWQWQFEEHETKREPFQITTGDSVEVEMMHQTWTFEYAEGETWQALELPYKAKGYRYGDWVMLIVLPRAVDGLAPLVGWRSGLRFGRGKWT